MNTHLLNWKINKPLLVWGCGIGLMTPLSMHGIAGFSITAGYFYADTEGTIPFIDNGVIQLVNLGDNGVFDSVLEGNWVGGDDLLISNELQVFNFGGEGLLQQAFTFDLGVDPNIDEGDKVGIRWFPHLTELSVPGVGDIYGEVTVQSNDAQIESWIVPAEGMPTETTIFASAISTDAAIDFSLPANFSGLPEFVVSAVPEPATFALGAGVLALLFARITRRTK